MGFSRACIYNWLAMYRAGGWDGLDARKRGGRPRKLNGRMIPWIYRVVVGKGSTAVQVSLCLVDPERHCDGDLSEVWHPVECQFGGASVGAVGNYSSEAPVAGIPAGSRAGTTVGSRRNTLRLPRKPNDCGRRSGLAMNRDCAAIIMRGQPGDSKGQTPVVRSTGARYRLNMISAVNRRGRMRFMIEERG